MNEPRTIPSNYLVSRLIRHQGGKLLEEASLKLVELVAAVHETGKPGTLTIRLNIKKAARGHSAVILTGKVECRAPVIEPEASFWFSNPEGLLCVDDPRQTELGFKSLPAATVTETHNGPPQAREVEANYG